MENDVVYFARRARQERAASTIAADKSVQLCHLELALAYEFRVRALASKDAPSVRTDFQSAIFF